VLERYHDGQENDEVEEDEVSLRCQVEVGSLLHVRLRLHSGRKQVVHEKNGEGKGKEEKEGIEKDRK